MKSLDKVWFTAKELEALKLNGLPSHATNITRKAKNENWLSREAKGVKYKFSKTKVENDGNKTVVIGTLSHNGSKKENVSIQIPCFNKDGEKVGDAIDSTDVIEKNKKWEFRAVLNTGDVKACKVKDAYVYAE